MTRAHESACFRRCKRGLADFSCLGKICECLRAVCILNDVRHGLADSFVARANFDKSLRALDLHVVCSVVLLTVKRSLKKAYFILSNGDAGLHFAYVAQNAFHHLERHMQETLTLYFMWRFFWVMTTRCESCSSLLRGLKASMWLVMVVLACTTPEDHSPKQAVASLQDTLLLSLLVKTHLS